MDTPALAYYAPVRRLPSGASLLVPGMTVASLGVLLGTQWGQQHRGDKRGRIQWARRHNYMISRRERWRVAEFPFRRPNFGWVIVLAD